VRGQALALPFFAAAWLLMAGWTWNRVVAYLGVAVAVVVALSMPWMARNTVVFDRPTTLSTNLGINLWLGHNEGASGGFDFDQQLGFAGFYSHLPLDEQELAWNRDGFRKGVEYALTHPLDEVRLSILKVANLYRDDSDPIRWNEQNGGAPIFTESERYMLRVIFDGFYYAIGLAAVAGLVVGLRRRERWLGPIASALVLWTLIHVAFFGEPRLHAPILPFLAIIATVPLMEAMRTRRVASPLARPATTNLESPVP
jgi:hypothetical protein